MTSGIYYSNKVEHLYGLLRDRIFLDNSSLFTRRLVVLPSEAMRQWLKLQMAEDPSLGICAGVDLLFLDQALDHLYHDKAKPPSATALTLLLEREIRRFWERGDVEGWEEVWRYLMLTHGKPWTRRADRRLSLLCEQLSKLFKQYGLFGAEVVADWKGGWQADLWHRIFPEGSPWRDVGSSSGKGLHLHLFTMSFLPPQIMRLLLDSNTTLSFYHLSPCAVFWSDIVTDRQSRRLHRFWEKKGANKRSLTDLDSYLRDRNGLLANFGRMGREMAIALEGVELESEEWYDLPEAPTLLASMQSDLLTLRNPLEEEPLVLDESDRSFEVHVVPSRRREIEILYDNILRHKGIAPRDVIVMAPDIMEYKSDIEAIFGAKESRLNYQIMDVRPEEENRLLQGLLLLWQIAESRWEVSLMSQLFSHPYFQKRWKIEPHEVERWTEWIHLVGVKWGVDQEHRNWILRHHYCRRDLPAGAASSTWEEGFSRLSDGLARGGLGIAINEAPLLARLIQLIRSLRNDLQPLIDGSEKSVEEWTGHLLALFDTYFEGEAREWEWIAAEMARFRESGSVLEGSLFRFTPVQAILNASLTKESVIVRENHLNSVRFCSMLPLRAIPTRVLALLGLEEGVYPGKNRLQSLNALVGEEKADYCPTRSDYDRYLFLEALLSARQQLLISYCGTSGGEEKSPSVLVSELLAYFDSGYRIGSQLPSQARVINHPFTEYDARYFRGDQLQSYRKQAFRLAEAHYGESVESPRFLDSWFQGKPPILTAPEEKEVTIAALEAFARSPLRSYFRDTLGLYIAEDEELTDEEPFTLSPLRRALVQREALVEGEQDVIAKIDVPTGLFRDVAVDELHDGVAEWRSHLSAMHTSTDDLFEITLTHDVSSCERISENEVLLPPLRVGDLTIVGRIKDLTPEGMLAYGRNSLSDVLKFWPRLLILQLIPDYTFGKRDLLLLKSGVRKESALDDPQLQLEKLISLFFINRRQPLPLLPEWTDPLLKGKPLPEDLKETFEGLWKTVYSQELHWTFRGEETLPGEAVLGGYKDLVQEVYGEVLKHV